MVDCALISSDEAFRHLILGLVRQPAAQARLVLDLQTTAGNLGPDAVKRILSANPRLVFLDLGSSTGGIEGLQALSQEVPEVGFVVTGPKLTAEGLLAVMRAGATEYLPPPLTQEEVLGAFRRARKRMAPTSGETAAPSGRVVAVLSPKGGTGVTTVATNLSLALVRLTGKEVLLLDLAPALGTAALAMGLQPRYTYVDVIQNFHRIDEELLRSFMEKHEPKVTVLASPMAPGAAVGLRPDQVLSLIRLCQRHFGYVVVDAGNALTDITAAILREADEEVIVLNPELPTLRNLKRILATLGQVNGKGPRKFVLNQFKEGLGLSPRDVEDSLGQALSAVIEREEDAIVESINLGRPVILVGKSRVAKSILGLAGKIAGGDRIATKRSGLLGRLMGRGGGTRAGKAGS
jgi:pilus assembly protein CpaE